MFSSKKKKAAKKIDTLITGVIIGSAIASIFGLSKTKKGKEITAEVTNKSKWVLRTVYEFFGRCMAWACAKNKKK